MRYFQNIFFQSLLFTACMCAPILAEEPSGVATKRKQPNIVIILSDDAGYSDFSFRGSKEFHTPNLDRLCREGVEFTQAYSPSSVCTPSRAGILTGRHPSSIGAEKNLRSKLHRAHLDTGLSTEATTLAEELKKIDYSTALIGKWHLGYGGKFHPNQRGFDHFFGLLAGSRDYFPMSAKQLELEENIPHRLQQNGKLMDEKETYYLTDQLTDKAIQFMKESNRHDKPFFVFLSYTAVHSPYQAKKTDLDRYLHVSPPRRTIGAMISSLDENVGRVMSALERLDLAENTLLVFTNDNGGTKEMSNAPYRGYKGSLFEGGIRVPFVARMPSKLSAGTKYGQMVSLLDIYPTCLSIAGAEADGIGDCDGVNLLDFLSSNKQPHEKLFFKFHSQTAIRKGDYKLYLNPKKQINALFNIADDRVESTNLVEKEPELAAQLREELGAWVKGLPEQHW